MAQSTFSHFGSGQNNQSVDPNDLMGGSYGNVNSFGNSNGNNYNGNSGNNAFSSGSAVLGDDELLDSLASPADTPGMQNHGQEYPGMGNMAFSQAQNYNQQRNSLQIDPAQMNGDYGGTPDATSPFGASFTNQFQRLQTGSLGNNMHSPIYSGSPHENGNDANYHNNNAQMRLSQQMQRKGSNTRNPMTPNLNTMSLGSAESPGFGNQNFRGHAKSPSGQWLNTPASYNSGFSSPMQQNLVPMNEVMMKGGTSMPAKLGAQGGSAQDIKRKRRRESHNLVERRRRDNINERIQDLSKLVPSHRLEDEKIRKLIQNGTPLSPTLEATSGLAGPGARRAAGATAGSITTGLPLDDKDKGPNKGDILNGAVSWTRDLMWMLHLKLQQQEEMMNVIHDLGGHFPFEMTEDEKRMQSELMEALPKVEPETLSYSRAAGSGLRVPNHTDYKGDPVNGTIGSGLDTIGLTPEPNGVADLNDPSQFLYDPDDNSGNASIDFKEEDEFDLDMTR